MQRHGDQPKAEPWYSSDAQARMAQIRDGRAARDNPASEGSGGRTLDIFYAFLALSVIVSLFGMVNTLVLFVFERTRKIGMLRAAGVSRRQVRRMIRHERSSPR